MHDASAMTPPVILSRALLAITVVIVLLILPF
jgi:hypothetical protein